MHSNTIKKLNLILLTSYFLQFAFCLMSNSIKNQSSDDEIVMLRKIIDNYLTKYFGDNQVFVSIICPPSEKNQYNILDDFFANLSEESSIKTFDHNILSYLDSSARGNRDSFILILIDDSKLLR